MINKDMHYLIPKTLRFLCNVEVKSVSVSVEDLPLSETLLVISEFSYRSPQIRNKIGKNLLETVYNRPDGYCRLLGASEIQEINIAKGTYWVRRSYLSDTKKVDITAKLAILCSV